MAPDGRVPCKKNGVPAMGTPQGKQGIATQKTAMSTFHLHNDCRRRSARHGMKAHPGDLLISPNFPSICTVRLSLVRLG
jgi:hypothetical protein